MLDLVFGIYLQHAVEFGKRFDRDNYGGGAPKGEYIRKVKLDNAIHNPQDAVSISEIIPYWIHRSR